MNKLSPMKNTPAKRFVNEEKVSRKAARKANKLAIKKARQDNAFQLELA